MRIVFAIILIMLPKIVKISQCNSKLESTKVGAFLVRDAYA